MVLGLYAKRFSDYLATEEGRRALELVQNRKSLFKENLEQENLGGLSPEDLTNLFSSLEKLGQDEGRRNASLLIDGYGIENIRETLKFVVHADQTVEKRFEEGLARFQGLPTEALMEFLSYAAPRDFCIWDEVAKQAMRVTGQAGLHGLTAEAFTGPIGPWEYVQAVVAMNHVRETLNSYLQRKADFLDVYLFCLYVVRFLRPSI